VTKINLPVRAVVFIVVALVLFVTYLTFDWTQFFLGIARLDLPERMYTRICKWLLSLVTLLMAVTIGRDTFNRRDTKRLIPAVVLIFAGDSLFFLDKIFPWIAAGAVLCFAAAHVLLVNRNMLGFFAVIREKGCREWIVWVLATLMVLFMAGLYYFTLYPLYKGTPLFWPIMVYAVILTASLWSAWSQCILGMKPRPETFIIAVGAPLFFMGDFMVGFNLILPAGQEKILTTFLTWLFYGPGIFLIALSGYRMGNTERTLYY
jgi:hypothetical protein